MLGMFETKMEKTTAVENQGFKSLERRNGGDSLQLKTESNF
jgi:hypothetical protein